MPVPDRIAALSHGGCPPREPWRIIRRFHRLSASRGLVAYALRTRAPLSRHPKAPIPYDLHVLGLPLAFILSQDQTLRCTIVFCFLFYSVSRVPPPDASLHPSCSLLGSFFGIPEPLGPGRLCWPQTFKELFRFRLPSSSPPRSFRKRVQKYYLFPNWQALFLKIFHSQRNSLTDSLKNFQPRRKHRMFDTYINIIGSENYGKKASSICSITGFPSLKIIEMISKRVSISRLVLKR